MNCLAQIDAPHYCAGMVIIGDKVIEAAPIIRWTIGKSYWYEVDKYFRKKKYGVILNDGKRGWVIIRHRGE